MSRNRGKIKLITVIVLLLVVYFLPVTKKVVLEYRTCYIDWSFKKLTK